MTTETDEAQRLLNIYLHHESAQRPVQAWGMLPLGMSVASTLAEISMMPVEIDDDGGLRDYYMENIAALIRRQTRDSQAQALKESKHHALH
jgi:hypothetical protein